MNTNTTESNQSAVLGQKYAFATASLLLGVASFIGLLGMEKAILAVLFGWLALRAKPSPILSQRRAWGKTGVALGIAHLVLVLGLLLAGANLVLAVAGLVTDYLQAVKHGPKVVQSLPSPNGEFLAYVEDMPSIDPPNQSLIVERRDQKRFMFIAKLAEDVDAIKKIYWSPDSQLVVFHSRYYLTATRPDDWQTVRIYLGQEWRRSQPDRRATFSAGEPRHEVTAVEFGASRIFSYRLKGDPRLHTVHLDSLAQAQ